VYLHAVNLLQTNVDCNNIVNSDQCALLSHSFANKSCVWTEEASECQELKCETYSEKDCIYHTEMKCFPTSEGCRFGRRFTFGIVIIIFKGKENVLSTGHPLIL
jgi:hypothetical protein